MPVLLLNGFGMGSFHQHRLMEALYHHHHQQQQTQQCSRRRKKSTRWTTWDRVDRATRRQRRKRGDCGTTWLDQIIQFVEQAVRRKDRSTWSEILSEAAACVAAARPDLIASVTLLNATPIWGLNLPGWSGHLSAPTVPKLVGRYLFDRMRNPATIEEFLATTYANRAAWYDDPTLTTQVRACTDGPGGLHPVVAPGLGTAPVRYHGRVLRLSASHSVRRVALFRTRRPLVQAGLCETHAAESPRPQQQQQHPPAIRGSGWWNHHSNTTNTAVCRTVRRGPLPEPRSTNIRSSSRTARSACGSGAGRKSMVVSEIWGETVVQERSEHEIQLNWIDRLATQIM